MAVSTWPDISHLSVSRAELLNVLRQMGQQDCVALKIKVNELLRKGHLREFFSEKAKSHLSKKTMGKPTEAAPVSPPRQDRVIHVISGGTDEISFTAKEQERVLTPHHDALVISLTVVNCLEGALTRRITPLIGFSGEVKQTAGEVHAQQYQKQQGNSTAILTKSCKLRAFNPQRSALLIDRQQHLFVARFSSTTVDPGTSPVDWYSLTTVDRRHSSSEGHLRNAAGQRIDAQGAAIHKSVLHQQIIHSSSDYSEGFQVEAAVLHTRGTNTLLWVISRASHVFGKNTQVLIPPNPRQSTGLWIPAGRNPGSQDSRWNEPRFPSTKYSGSGPQDRPFPPGKWKTSDRENLPYFRIWKSLTYSNRLRPALGRLYKGNLNPKARDRHFETWRL
ncbi:hypothetical protein F2Q69_00047184 [Brassica cretica]|uniref:Uncharacterized protein n=1 Tax=Brassica cretica TaxID=69181 RepID=A0A8S9PND9_BRACR|nr:hypothetical protein F2Q69_00047184 [Brassica cretica]